MVIKPKILFLQTSQLTRNRSDTSIQSHGTTLKNEGIESHSLPKNSIKSQFKHKLPRGAGFRNLSQAKTQKESKKEKNHEQIDENNFAINIMPTIE